MGWGIPSLIFALSMMAKCRYAVSSSRLWGKKARRSQFKIIQLQNKDADDEILASLLKPIAHSHG